MALEIEKKYLVDEILIKDAIKNLKPVRIIQGYISNNKSGVVRIRIKSRRAFLTIKSANQGITRHEYEYKIPYRDGIEMLNSIEKKITKDRYKIKCGNHFWEVDFFKEKLDGLIVAEIELESEEEIFEVPSWVKEDVSDDPQYYNSNLIER